MEELAKLNIFSYYFVDLAPYQKYFNLFFITYNYIPKLRLDFYKSQNKLT
jgi:hypothetical protein